MNTLRTRREAAGISLRQFAYQLGISSSHLSRVESGERSATKELLAAANTILAAASADTDPSAT